MSMGPDEDGTQRDLDLLRDGSPAEQIEARLNLARVCEQRGMIDEAVELLETNLTAGLNTPEFYRWLASLYATQGQTVLSGKMTVLAQRIEARRTPPIPPTPATRIGMRKVSLAVGGFVFVALVVAIETLDARPGELNPLRSLWYVFTMANGTPALFLTLELVLPALAALVTGSLVGRLLASPEEGRVREWTALTCGWVVGLVTYVVLFAAGEALLAASFRARLPIWFWMIYYVFVGAYMLNVGLGLFVHLLISSTFAFGAGQWLYKKIAPS